MKLKVSLVLSVFLVFLALSTLCYSQSEQKGEISGIVQDDNGVALPGVSLLLKGEKMFQKSLSAISNQKGVFRFRDLNPGVYELEVSLEGFNVVKFSAIPVSVGKSTPVTINMIPAKLKAEITVVAKAPLIETKTPQLVTSFTNFQIENTPSSRHFIDIVDASPGSYDQTSYGSGAAVNNAPVSRGSMTSSFRLNGVDVGDPGWGFSNVSPIYESIEEIQVAGIGISAEYGNFTGAMVNVITKSGSKEFHGSLNGVYSDSETFYANYNKTKDVQYYNYAYHWNYDYAISTTLSGPLIKEKLFFSLAGSQASRVRHYATGFSVNEPLDLWGIYAKFDYLLNSKNTLSLMYNYGYGDQGNQGLYASYYDPSVAFRLKAPTHTVFASWNTILSENSFLYVKFAGYNSIITSTPANPDVPQYTNNAASRVAGGSTSYRKVYSSNFELNAALTYFADSLFGMSHEFKFGLEYQDGRAGEERRNCGGGNFYSALNVDGTTNWVATVGGNQDFLGNIKSARAFIQDNIKVNKNLIVNLGLRFENPRFNARNYRGSGDIARFNAFSPRIGFTYDLAGDQKTVFRGSFGVYYSRPLTNTFSQSFPGNADRSTYILTLPAEVFNPTFDNIKARLALIAQPQNLSYVTAYSQVLPVDPNIKLNNNYTFNVGFSRKLGSQFAVDVDYIYKEDHNRYQVKSSVQHTFREYQWTDPWLGNTITLWDQVDRLSNSGYQTLTNSSFAKKNDHLLIIQLRKMPSANWSFIASYTYQNSKTNLPSLGVNDLYGFASYDMDTDPAWTKNPNQWGRQMWMREHQGKIMTTYFGPLGINVTADLRILSGFPWNAQITSSVIPSADRPYRGTGYPEINLEKRGIRGQPVSWNLNFRVAKSFKIKSTRLQLQLDLFNALNAEYYWYVWMQPYALFSNGTPAFGKPRSLLTTPRNGRIGFTWNF